MFGLFVQKHAEAVNLYADVRVLYVHPDENIRDLELIDQYHNDLNEIIVYYPVRKSGYFSKYARLKNLFKAYYRGFNYLKEKKFAADIIQANVFAFSAVMAYLLSLRCKIPYAVIEHWTRYDRNLSKSFLEKRMSFIAKKASGIFPVTYRLQLSMEKQGLSNKNYRIVNNVVNDLYFEAGFEKTEQAEKKRILNITCFNDEQKNLTGILHTISELSKKRQDFEVYLIGDGVDFEKIRSLSDSLNLSENFIFFTGTLVGEDLVRFYESCRFTFLFSNYENIPVVISESLACGKPVISTDVGGISEHVNAENGLLIDKMNEKMLFDALDYMLDNYQSYDRQKMRNIAYQNYSYSNVGKKLMEYYTEILK
jgi:glycosyltransferase involved in cell wall biosynthesis